jgi:phenylacetate-coenzyme A ligase PaaK-like adenylate-forming protein
LNNFKNFNSLLYTINEENALDIALKLFRFQAENNPVYGNYIHHLGVNPEKVKTIEAIPFLPISFFKNLRIQTGSWKPETTFTSSGTTGLTASAHLIADTDFYTAHAEKCFSHFFGSLKGYHIFALMPSYLERKDSSLIAMLESFITKTDSPYSGFYLYDYEKLAHDLNRAKKDNRKIILWGVSFALLDFAEKFRVDLAGSMVIETGGMKGRRKEITRPDLHEQLKKHFNVSNVYSEYGMTELLSQAYTNGDDLFYPSPWMKIVVREIADPLEKGLISKAGGLNVIDYANFHSISFIETEDAGKIHPNGAFEVLGRLDNSDVRGCNLMIE